MYSNRMGFALRFAVVLAGLTVISRLLGRFVGPQALLPFAAVAGFADLDAATLAIAQTRSAPAAIAGGAVLIAAASNTALKSGLALALGGRQFGAYFAGGSALAVIAAAAAWFGARALGFQAP